MEWMLSPELWVAFGTLLLLEIVLGIDNVIFISILADRLPEEQRARARVIGLSLALITRLLLLASLSWVIGLTAPLFTVVGQEVSGRDLILLLGGLFLVAKATYEIHGQLEGAEHAQEREVASFAAVIAVGYATVALNYVVPEAVFTFLLNTSAAIALFIWLAISLSQLRMRRELERTAPERRC